MNHLPLSRTRVASGQANFLLKHPHIKAKIDAVAQSDANALGVELTELREVEIAGAISAQAEEEGCDAMEYFFRYVAETTEVLDEMIRERRAQINRDLGL